MEELKRIVCIECGSNEVEFRNCSDSNNEWYCRECGLTFEQLELIPLEDKWKIDSIDKADWALEKLYELEKKIITQKNRYESKLNKLNAWNDAEMKLFADDKSYLEMNLTDYYKEQKAKDKKFRLNNEYAEFKERSSTVLEVQDEEKLTEYLLKNLEESVTTTTKINKTLVKKTFKDGVNIETGEVVPGMELVKKINYKVNFK
ncbi:MAG: host-nuclease inhibitor Gam family protein [Sarcina sp.]